MSSASTFNLVCLFEDEMRVAARALSELRRVEANEASTSDELEKALVNVLNACGAALFGADAEDAVLVLTRLPPR